MSKEKRKAIVRPDTVTSFDTYAARCLKERMPYDRLLYGQLVSERLHYPIVLAELIVSYVAIYTFWSVDIVDKQTAFAEYENSLTVVEKEIRDLNAARQDCTALVNNPVFKPFLEQARGTFTSFFKCQSRALGRATVNEAEINRDVREFDGQMDLEMRIGQLFALVGLEREEWTFFGRYLSGVPDVCIEQVDKSFDESTRATSGYQYGVTTLANPRCLPVSKIRVQISDSVFDTGYLLSHAGVESVRPYRITNPVFTPDMLVEKTLNSRETEKQPIWRSIAEALSVVGETIPNWSRGRLYERFSDKHPFDMLVILATNAIGAKSMAMNSPRSNLPFLGLTDLVREYEESRPLTPTRKTKRVKPNGRDDVPESICEDVSDLVAHVPSSSSSAAAAAAAMHD